MKVFITGISGQLGYDTAKVLEARGIEYKGVSSAELDITDASAVKKALTEYAPDAVIHCAAYTKVDAAEDVPELCWRVNAEGTKNIALVCREIGAKLVYISTDYVFPGEGEAFYETEDAVRPLNVYGMTKYAGELAVRSISDQYFIVRTSWVIGINGNNFVKTMLRLAETHDTVSVVADQIGSPTFTFDLAPLLCDMIETEKYGTYHATNEGVCSWAELAQAVFSLSGKNMRTEPITTEQFGAKARRPHNSRLSKAALESRGFARLPDWEKSLERYVALLLPNSESSAPKE